MSAPRAPRCPDDNALAQLVAGELPERARAEVERHLGGCAACAQLIAEYARASPQRRVPARFRLLRQLGGGAMGEVWEADDTALGRRVALKFVRPEATADPEYQARLVREARALARLRHPNVVAVHDLEQDEGGELFVALELVDGANARAWRSAAPRTTSEVLDVWRKVADGLAAAHKAGIVHRDLKPDNVFISGDGRVVLGDFGLASLAADGSAALTATGQIVGTPLYMPLEQLRGGAATPRSDQFSLCVCLWEALSGSRPFRGGTLAALVDGMRERPRPPRAGRTYFIRAPSTSHSARPLASLFPDPRAGARCSGLRSVRARRALYAVLARGLDPDPARRWPDVAALSDALERAGRRTRWRTALAVVVLAALAVALAALAIARVRSAPSG